MLKAILQATVENAAFNVAVATALITTLGGFVSRTTKYRSEKNHRSHPKRPRKRNKRTPGLR